MKRRRTAGRWWNRIKPDSLQKRLMVYSFMLLVIVITLCVLVSGYVCRKTVVNEIKTIHEGTASGVVTRINMMLEEMMSILNIVSRDRDLSSGTLPEPAKDEQTARDKGILNPIQQNETGYQAGSRLYEHQIENNLSSYIKDYGMIEAIVYVQGEKSIYAGFNSLFYLSDEGYKNPDTYRGLGEIYTKLKSRKADARGIYFSRLDISGSSRFIIFKPLEGKDGKVEYFLIALQDDFLDSVKFNATYAYMVKDQYTINMSNSSIDNIEDILTGPEQDVTGAHLIFQKNINTDGWKFVLLTDIRDVLDDISGMQILFALLSLLYILIITLMTVPYTKRITRYLKKLQDFIAAVMKSNFSNIRPFKMETGKRIFRLRPFKVRTKILFYFFFIIIVPVFFITLVTYNKSVTLIKEKVGIDVENSIKSSSYQVNFIMENYLKTCLSISTRADISRYMKEADQGKDRADISNLILNKLVFYQDIVNVSIYDNNGNMSFTLVNNSNEPYRKEIQEEIGYLKLHSTEKVWKRLSWNNSAHDFFHIAMRLRDAESTPLGYLMLDFGTGQIRDIFAEIIHHNRMAVSLLDASGKSIYNAANNDLVVNSGNISVICLHEQGNLKQIKGDTTYYIQYSTLDVNGWKLVTTVPVDDYLQSSNTILIYNAVMLLFYIVIVVFASLRFSGAASKNLDRLKAGVRGMKNRELCPVDVEKSGDEIEELGHMFNMMAENTRKLINEVYVTEIKVKEAQFNALQAQINPHFLYNTLETIHYMIVINDKRAIEMVQLLGDLFRVGIGRGEKFVTIEQELNHIRLYIEIQRIRYSNRFKVVFDIDDEIKTFYTIKFLLQPMVENAIYHGMELMEEGGLITITGKLENGNVKLCVRDNGEGMDAVTINGIYDKLEGRVKSKSIGFVNVHDRIRLYFGSQYGLKVESRVNEGTEVTIELPALRTNPETRET